MESEYLKKLNELMDENEDLVLSRWEDEWILRDYNFYDGYHIVLVRGSTIEEVVTKYIAADEPLGIPSVHFKHNDKKESDS